MRIVQIIDSLEAGGAERMAVSFANALSSEIAFSGLLATRNEGALKSQIDEKVHYSFLNKKHNFDFKGLFRIRSYLSKNKITIIHAHGSSFFWATLVKIIYPKVKIIWHDHFGNRSQVNTSATKILKVCSFLFYGIISVNDDLKNWSLRNLHCKKVIYLPNFILQSDVKGEKETVLKGAYGKRIVFLANLKHPKNHLQILKSFREVHGNYPNWTLHLIGKDYQDGYSKILKEYVNAFNLQYNILFYDSCNDIPHILSQATVGILGSTYEGFPVTLLEYGNASLTVMSTNVGYCSTIITNLENGILFNPLQHDEISTAFEKVLLGIENDDPLFLNFGKILKQHIDSKYSQKTVMNSYISFLK